MRVMTLLDCSCLLVPANLHFETYVDKQHIFDEHIEFIFGKFS